MVDRATIVARLRELAALLALHGASKFKVRAFERGARALEAMRGASGDLGDEGIWMQVPGIGVAIACQIGELRRRGTSDLLESLRSGLPAGVLELSQVSGIGLHALKALHDTLGIATIDDLRDAAREGRLRGVKGFGEKKEAKVLAAIERYETRAPVITLGDGLRLADGLQGEIGAMPGVRSVHLVGTLARFAELSSEVELVVAANDPHALVAAVSSMPRVGTVERREASECRLRLADGVRVVVAACSPRDLPATLALRRASPEHYAKLTARAEALGYRLAPDALQRGGRPVPLRDEKALYGALGLSWVPPEMREDAGEFEAAVRGDRFDLIDGMGVRGFVHCHTTWSDGKAGIEEMALAAEARGAQFITITDHSATAHYAGGLDVDRLKRQWDEIAAVQERVSIRILRGSEADILADGALDWPDPILERMDVIIASIHNRYRQDEAKMTERVLRAMRHPFFKIWGHPLGRLVTSRPPIPLRVEEVLDALADSRGAIEISGDPHRLDLEPRWVRAARQRGIPFVLSVDAHSIRDLDYARYAVGLARRAGVRTSEVLNARSAEAFARAVHPAGHVATRLGLVAERAHS